MDENKKCWLSTFEMRCYFLVPLEVELFLISSPACELGNSGITRNHQTYFCRWKDKCVTTWYLLPQLHALHSGKPIWSFAFTPVQRGPNELATGGCKLLPFNSILGVGSWEISFTPLKKRRSASRYRSNWPCSHFSYKFVPFFSQIVEDFKILSCFWKHILTLSKNFYVIPHI